MLKLNKKWFNPLYFIIDDIAKDETIRRVLIYGGKGSAKTASICQFLTKECYAKGASSVSFRKESTTIPTTLKKSFKLALETMYMQPAFEVQDRRYLCVKGSEMVLKGLDDEEKAKGVEGYKYVYVDELNHFLQSEYDQMDLSLRGIPGQKLFGSWNPVSDQSWIKTEIVDKTEWHESKWRLPSPDSFVRISADGKTVLIKTVYQDNYWIAGSPCGTYGYRDENLIHTYEGYRTKNYNTYKVNVLGEWGKTEYGGEILKCWRSERDTGDYKYNPNLAVWLFFDENVNPYFPCGIFQVADNQKDFRMIYAIAAKNPNNTVKWMTAELCRLLRLWGHKGRVFVGGDATSQKEDVKQEKGHDLFRLIMNGLAEFKPTLRVAPSNPSVVMSAEFFNSILSDNAQGITFGVDKECRVAILDFENTKEDKNGKVDKKTVTDPVTKVSYQPYGHFFDLTRYALTTVFAKEYSDYQRGDKPVMISMGKKSRNQY